MPRSQPCAERSFQALFERAPVGVAVMGHDGRMLDANPVMGRMLGYAPDELRGHLLSEVVTVESETPAPGLDAGGARAVACRYRRRDGSHAWAHSVTWPIPSSEFEGAFSLHMLQDVTEAREEEARLRSQEALTRLGEMATVLAHEVRNPLAGISGALQVIRDRLPTAAAERVIMEEIQERLRSLNNIVDDLLLFARPIQLRRQSVSLHAVLADAARDIRSARWGGAIEVEIVGDQANVLADPTLLGTLFRKLYANAAQAMGGGGIIRASVVAGPAQCRVDVLDSGPGLPTGKEAQVFQPFFTTKTHGTGLGLAIARRIVESHGGAIDAGSSGGAGTVIAVLLPAAP